MMGDSCLCMDADFEDTYTLKEVIVTAKQDYECCECQDKIEINQDYEFAQTKSDGKVFTHRTCIPCMNMRKDLFKCNWFYGQIWEDLQSYFEEILSNDEDAEYDDWKWLYG